MILSILALVAVVLLAVVGVVLPIYYIRHTLATENPRRLALQSTLVNEDDGDVEFDLMESNSSGANDDENSANSASTEVESEQRSLDEDSTNLSSLSGSGSFNLDASDEVAFFAGTEGLLSIQNGLFAVEHRDNNAFPALALAMNHALCPPPPAHQSSQSFTASDFGSSKMSDSVHSRAAKNVKNSSVLRPQNSFSSVSSIDDEDEEEGDDDDESEESRAGVSTSAVDPAPCDSSLPDPVVLPPKNCMQATEASHNIDLSSGFSVDSEYVDSAEPKPPAVVAVAEEDHNAETCHNRSHRQHHHHHHREHHHHHNRQPKSQLQDQPQQLEHSHDDLHSQTSDADESTRRTEETESHMHIGATVPDFAEIPSLTL